MKQILRLIDVITQTGLSKATLYRLMATGNFPRPLGLTRSAVGWQESDIDEWISKRIARKASHGLTEHQAKTTQGREKEYTLSDAYGLCLVVRPNGRKYWRWEYRFDGKKKKLSLGVYPKVSLEMARITCAQWRERLKAGIDPSIGRI